MSGLTRLALSTFLLAGCGDLNIEAPTCPEGAITCPCSIEGACDGPLLCAEGRCVPPSPACPPGEIGCACNDGLCDAGLECGDVAGQMLCLESCPTGGEGCRCRNEVSCDLTDDGTPMECFDGACRRPLCTPGALDCICAADGGCDDGVCDDGVCREDTGQTLEAPANPRCYTPCRGGGLDGPDGYRACANDGLIDGCIGGNVCLDGNCVKLPPGGGRVELRTCRSDYQCPAFQTCIDNRCYSDCGADGEDGACREGRVCDRRVCRLPCALRGDPCPTGQWCDARDGVLGYCRASGPARPGGQADNHETLPPAEFVVEPGRLTFRPEELGEQTGAVVLRHDAEHGVDVVIRPLAHTLYTDDDSEKVQARQGQQPLCWVQLGVDGADAAADGSLSVRIPPGDGLTLTVTNTPAEGCDAASASVGRLSVAEATEWFGTIEITDGDATHLLNLKAVRPDGRWTGSISFYGNFGTGSMQPWLDALRAGDEAAAHSEVRFVENAFIRRWWAFRSGVLPFDEFAATVDATENENWRTPLMERQCPAPTACYPISNLDGFSVYTDDIDSSPIPTGHAELSIALNLRADPAGDDGVSWSGRIDSTVALQYPGNPAVRIEFGEDPLRCFGGESTERCPLTGFSAISVVGGRYTASTEGGCAASAGALEFGQAGLPWFQRFFGDFTEDGDGNLTRTECRGTSLAVEGDGEPLSLPTGDPEIDASLTAANPIPNGRPLVRRLELLDGVLFNSDQMFIIFREQLPELFPGAGASYGYGYMWLTRAEGRLDDEDFEAVEVPQSVLDAADAALTPTPAPLDTICSTRLIEDSSAGTADGLMDYAISGAAVGGALVDLSQGRWSTHWLCVDTGRFDGPCPVSSEVRFFSINEDNAVLADEDLGIPEDLDDPDEWACNSMGGRCRAGEPCAIAVAPGESCPDGSLDANEGRVPPNACFVEEGVPCSDGDENCDRKGSCADVLDHWTDEQTVGVLIEPTDAEVAGGAMGQFLVWRCIESTSWCSGDRLRLTSGKTFYGPADPDVDVPAPAGALQDIVDTGFSYRTRFRSRLDGGSVGFAPRECGGSTTPYCYDANEIKQAAERYDCLGAHYALEQDAPLSFGVRRTVSDVLRKAFSFDQTFEGGRSLPTIYFGFEYLFAELMITLGDDAYAQSFVTRFDLANELVADFPGDALEPGGIELSGAAGYELFALYLAVQSYQVALDRFIGMRDVVGAMLDPGFAHEGLIDASAATTWFRKLLRASSQKARAGARIAERYHRLDQPALARHVVERSYAAAWLESIYFSQLMKQVLNRATSAQKAQVQQEIEIAQLVYKDALLVMRELHAAISDEVTFFGFAKDYVPFPAIDPGVPNAFEILMERARTKAEVALDKEATALDDRRAFETDEAEFLSTLTELQLDADGALAEICGFLEVPDADGNVSVYPATSDYAHLSPDIRVRELGDPCGLVGNGTLSQAYQAVAGARSGLANWQLEYHHIIQRIEDEQQKLSEQCDRIITFGDWTAGIGGSVVLLKEVQAVAGLVADAVEGTEVALTSGAEGANCNIGLTTNCVGKITAVTAKVTVGAWSDAAQAALKVTQNLAEVAINTIEEVVVPLRDAANECEALTIDSKFEVRELFRGLQAHIGSGGGAVRDVDAAVGEVQHLLALATCVQATAAEQRRLTVDIESARNDPNVRIYRNSAIIHAERTFDAAVAAAWRATRGFEYYTNQSYAARDRLPLVRMVGNGDVTLESYLDELEDAFNDWEEIYGIPDLRVSTISVQAQTVGELAADNTPYSGATCAERFRTYLRGAPRNADGYITIPFRTSLADPDTFPESGPVLTQVSPLTHNHKIRFIEVELVGPEGVSHGDDLARVYVRQGADGFGELREPGSGLNRYFFPQRTAVVDTFFNGERPLEDALGLFEGSTQSPYRNERLRDRPLHHTDWSLVLHPTDEPVNRDFDITAWLDDIKIHIWYTDFTEL